MIFSTTQLTFLDGALGTELQRRGYNTALPLWSAKALFDCPEVVEQIHYDYIMAGTDIITTNTFRTQRRTLAKADLAHDTERINAVAVQCAVRARQRAALRRPIYIAGSLTTVEDCYRPDLVPDNASLAREHSEQATILAQTPIDFFLLETFNTVREAKAATAAATATGKPVAVSFVLNAAGNLLSGESIAQAVATLEPYEPVAYLVNCIAPTTATLGIQKLRTVTAKPIGAYANGDGRADDDQGWLFNNDPDLIECYVRAGREWQTLGATIIGGCCGTNPDYTAAYAQLR